MKHSCEYCVYIMPPKADIQLYDYSPDFWCGWTCFSLKDIERENACRYYCPCKTSVFNEKECGKMDKPRICEVLGVEVGEEFRLKDHIGFGNLAITNEGFIRHVDCGNPILASVLCDLINNPELLVKIVKVTEQEKVILKILKDAGYKKINACNGDEVLATHITKDKSCHSVVLRTILPSLKDGDSIDLEQFFKE